MMTVKDVCKSLGVSRDTVYRLIQLGKLPASRVGGQWRFEQDDLDKVRAVSPSDPDPSPRWGSGQEPQRGKIGVKPEIMTLKEVCEYLGLNRRTIYRLINNKKLSAVKSGGQWRLAKDDVKRFLAGDRDVPSYVMGMYSGGGVMSLSEVTKALGVTRRTVYRLIKEGKLPATKVGGVWRFIKSEVGRYIIDKKYSYGTIGIRGCFFWLRVLDKYYKDPQIYYIRESAYDGFVGSRQDYYDYKTLSASHNVMEWDRFFVDLHYRKVAVKGGVILVLTPKQYEGLPAKEQIHWGQHRLSDGELKRVEL